MARAKPSAALVSSRRPDPTFSLNHLILFLSLHIVSFSYLAHVPLALSR